MHVCNISFQIEPSIKEVWLQWMHAQFIPSLIASECFASHQFYELEVAEDQGPTFTLQLYAIDATALTRFKQTHANLFDLIPTTWGEQCFHFSSFMRSVD